MAAPSGATDRTRILRLAALACAFAFLMGAGAASAQYDSDGDGYPDSEPDTDGDGYPDSQDPDADGDGYYDAYETGETDDGTTDPTDDGQGAGFDYDCTESRKNMQCNGFGTIKMDSEAKVKGEPITLHATVELETNYQDAGARWIMFSIRNNTEEDGEPISVELTGFTSPSGDLKITQTKRPGDNELNLWLHVMDVPIGEPIELTIQVGASDRGAFKLEVLVMAFDSSYAPITDSSGASISLFSYTLLSVSEESEAVSDEGGGRSFAGRKLPGPALPATVAALAAVALLAARRRQA